MPRATVFPYTTLFRSEAGTEGCALKGRGPMAAKAKRARSRRPVSAKGAVPMADSTAGLLFQEVRASIERMPARGERLRSEEHTPELQSRGQLVCRLLP